MNEQDSLRQCVAAIRRLERLGVSGIDVDMLCEDEIEAIRALFMAIRQTADHDPPISPVADAIERLLQAAASSGEANPPKVHDAQRLVRSWLAEDRDAAGEAVPAVEPVRIEGGEAEEPETSTASSARDGAVDAADGVVPRSGARGAQAGGLSPLSLSPWCRS